MINVRAFACVALLGLARGAAAQTLLETSFEGPAFAVGNVVGQQSWTTDGGGTAARITTLQARTGVQSLQINAAQLPLQAWWFVPLNHESTGQVINITWSMYIDSPSTLSRSSYGIDIYSPNLTRLLDVFSEALFDGELLHNALGTGTVVPLRQWHEYRARLDFATFSYSIFYDGTQVGSGALDSSAGTVIGDVDLWCSSPDTDVAYFDDFSIVVGDPQQACVADVDDDGNVANGLNPDGAVTIDDLIAYLTLFEAGAVEADCDDGSMTGTRDNAVTIEDLLYYLIRFEAGC